MQIARLERRHYSPGPELHSDVLRASVLVSAYAAFVAFETFTGTVAIDRGASTTFALTFGLGSSTPVWHGML